MEEPKKGAGVDGIGCQHFSGDGYSANAEALGVVGGQKDRHLVRQRRHTNDL